MSKILFVDDDRNLCETMGDVLKNAHHIADFAYDGEAAKIFLETSRYQLIVLDWTLTSSISGLDILRALRASGSISPVLFLTGKTDVADVEKALDAGADDYLTKPFSTGEFLARVRALLRRAPPNISKTLTYKDLVLFSERYSATVSNLELKLFPREFGVLEVLMRGPGESFSYELILDAAWKDDDNKEVENLRQIIIRLRKKLKAADSEIQIVNVYGTGYRLE